MPPSVHVLDLMGPVQVFYEAATYGQPYRLTYCSYQGALCSSAGLSLGPLVPFADVVVASNDVVFVPGLEMSYLQSTAFRREGAAFFAWLRALASQGVRLCSICTGAFVLTEAGLLDGRKCTTHWRQLAELQNRFPRVLAQADTLFVQDRGVYTSAGVKAGIDLALFLLEEWHGPLFATKVARELVVYTRRGAGHSQQSVYLDYRNHLHSGVHEVQDWLTNNLAAGATLDALAERVHMSPRTLTRTFRQATGLSIHAYTAALRRELAITLRRNPALTQEAIAAQRGLRSVRQLQRLLATTGRDLPGRVILFNPACHENTCPYPACLFTRPRSGWSGVSGFFLYHLCLVGHQADVVFQQRGLLQSSDAHLVSARHEKILRLCVPGIQ